MLVFRFLAGFGGAAPQSIGGGVVGDLWSPEERGMAMSVYSLAPLIGPSTGPLVGGFIAQYTNWQWVFWIVSIADACLQIAGFVCNSLLAYFHVLISFCPTEKMLLEETYAPQILKKRASAMRRATGNPRIRSSFELPDSRWTAVLGRGIVKPVVFLATEPIVQVFSLYMAILYGVLYLCLTSTYFFLSRALCKNISFYSGCSIC